MTDHISPEEKLLRLIRKPKRRDSPLDNKAESLSPPSARPPIIKKVNFSFKNSLAEFILNRKNIHKLLFIFFVIALLYLVGALIYPYVFLKEINPSSISSAKISDSEFQIKQEIKPFDYYLQAVKNRNIFNSAVFGSTSDEKTVRIDTDFAKDLNLLGVVSGDNPQAIIEDKKAQKTYYVNKGQYINEFKVEDIQEGMVILSYKGQSFQLHL